MHVLIVDTNAETRTGLARMIRDLGHTCRAAESGDAALQLLKSSFPDVIVMDVLLPDSDTRQFIRTLRARLPLCRIVVMTRPRADSSVREALNWGASDFLEKPVHELRLACLLSNLQPRHASTSAAAGNSDCVPEAFFNADPAAYQAARSRFEKAVEMRIPFLIEGEPGTGKATLAIHFATHYTAGRTLVEFDASTDDLDRLLRDPTLTQNARNTQKCCILVRRVEAAGPAAQRRMVEFFRASSHSLICTTRGRLLDHARSGGIDAALYNMLSPVPVWLAPLHERTKTRDHLARLMMQQANQVFGTCVQQIDFTAANAGQSRFYDNLSGLKRAIFSAVAGHHSPLSPAPLRSASPGASEPAAPARMMADTAQPHFAMLPLLDENGQLRPLKVLETEALQFAYRHYGARVGRIAKALKLGRTTLYRKLRDLGLTEPPAEISTEHLPDFVQKNAHNHRQTSGRTGRHAA